MKVVSFKVKVTEARKLEYLYSCSAKLRSAITLVLYNKATKFVCSMGILAMVDRMV